MMLRLCLLLWVILLARWVHSLPPQNTECDDAPTEALKDWCRQLEAWDLQSRTRVTFRSRHRPKHIPTHYDCFDLDCLCEFLPNGGCNATVERAVRKEYRLLTDEERHRFHEAMNAMKNSTTYATTAMHHADAAESGGAHTGPAFLPWHREFLKRFEFDLRRIDPDVALPYWDSSLDACLPEPRDSMLWTPDFLGEADDEGLVVNGAFAGWNTTSGREHVLRQLTAEDPSMLLAEDKINQTLAHSDFRKVMAYVSNKFWSSEANTCPAEFNCVSSDNPDAYNCLEMQHGMVHVWVGGDMSSVVTSSNDPTFFLHHAFVDLIWELWRLKWQTREERESQYPEDNIDCMGDKHFRNTTMDPFYPVKNFQGLSNNYTDFLFTYDDRPTCTEAKDDCRSPYLFCDRSHGTPHCVAKVRLGGNCQGFVDTNICFEGTCKDGRCTTSALSAIRSPKDGNKDKDTIAVLLKG